MVDFETSLISLVLGGIGGAIFGAIASYLLRRREKKQEEEARANNLREHLYTEISRNLRKLYSLHREIDGDINNYNLRPKFQDEIFARKKLREYLAIFDTSSRFDAYNYAKLHPDIFYRLERSECTHIEDIYECYSLLPRELRSKELQTPHRISKDRIMCLWEFLHRIIYGAQEKGNRLRNLIKDLDKDLFAKVTKQPDYGMLQWIFDSNNKPVIRAPKVGFGTRLFGGGKNKEG
jgi:hypothetical protein